MRRDRAQPQSLRLIFLLQRRFQVCFRSVSDLLQVCFQVYLRFVPGMVQACFRYVSDLFHVCFRYVHRYANRYVCRCRCVLDTYVDRYVHKYVGASCMHARDRTQPQSPRLLFLLQRMFQVCFRSVAGMFSGICKVCFRYG